MLPMTKKENLNFDLPEDIILKILCCLPIKSLIRFSCVSKRWRTITISDPQFAKSHMKLASEQRTISRRLLILSIFPTGCIKFSKPLSGLPSRFQSLENLFGDINSSVTNLAFPSKEHGTDVMASCNGLVIVGSFCKVLSIWNPSTGFFRTIPDPDFSSVTKKKREVSSGKKIANSGGQRRSIPENMVLVMTSRSWSGLNAVKKRSRFAAADIGLRRRLGVTCEVLLKATVYDENVAE